MKYHLILFTIILIFVTTAYGQQFSDTVVDIDGNVYHTVKIGTRTWMKENLKVIHFNNGDTISKMNIPYDRKDKKECAYYKNENDTIFNTKLGLYYNWYVINDNRNISPKGYHVATLEDWCDLLKQFCTDSIQSWLPLRVKINDTANLFLPSQQSYYGKGRPNWWLASRKHEEQPCCGVSGVIDFIQNKFYFECVPELISFGLPIICVKDLIKNKTPKR